MAVALGAKRKTQDTKEHDLYNPWWDTLKKGNGTLMYDGKWNLFDQIVFTGNLLGNDRSTLKYYRNEIFRRDYMFQKEGKFLSHLSKSFGLDFNDTILICNICNKTSQIDFLTAGIRAVIIFQDSMLYFFGKRANTVL